MCRWVTKYRHAVENERREDDRLLRGSGPYFGVIFSRRLLDCLGRESRVTPQLALAPQAEMSTGAQASPCAIRLWGEHRYVWFRILPRAKNLHHASQCPLRHRYPTRARARPQDPDPPRGPDLLRRRKDPISRPRHRRPVSGNSEAVALRHRLCPTWGETRWGHSCERYGAVEAGVWTAGRRRGGAPRCKDHS